MQKTTHSLVSGFFLCYYREVQKHRRKYEKKSIEAWGGASSLSNNILYCSLLFNGKSFRIAGENFLKKNKGFTLAEVLITLGIIGIVAAMTIPTLISKYQEKQVVSGLTKVYSTLSQAYQMVQAEHGQLSTWGLKNTNNDEVDDEGVPIYDHSANILISERLKRYLKVAKTCEAGKVCYPGAWYSIGGIKIEEANKVVIGDEYSDSAVSERFFLQDGTYIQMGNFFNNRGAIFVILPVYKDAILGKNRFYFTFDDNGLYPAGRKGDSIYAFDEGDFGCNPSSTYKYAGMGCAAWVIYNKNMDYLHCRSKLDWDGPHSCKEADN